MTSTEEGKLAAPITVGLVLGKEASADSQSGEEKSSLLAEAVEHPRWFKAVLQNHGQFNGIPVAKLARTAIPSVYVYMDASGTGLCALEPRRREFIRVQYTLDELQVLQSMSYDNSINVRELQSAVLAALHW
ncbi:hypothetical protein PHMEG_00035696, partial [Phytophthora megakarya]